VTDFVKDAMSDIERRLKDTSQKIARRMVLGLLAVVIALVGLSFLTASAYLALRTTLTDVQATLGFGLMFLLIAAVLLLHAKRQSGEKTIPVENEATERKCETNVLGPTVAFTTAFILARVLSDRKRSKTNSKTASSDMGSR